MNTSIGQALRVLKVVASVVVTAMFVGAAAVSVATRLGAHDYGIIIQAILAVGWLGAFLLSLLQQERHSEWAWALLGLSLAFATAWVIIATMRLVSLSHVPGR
jgi:hypothetical protein